MHTEAFWTVEQCGDSTRKVTRHLVTCADFNVFLARCTRKLAPRVHLMSSERNISVAHRLSCHVNGALDLTFGHMERRSFFRARPKASSDSSLVESKKGCSWPRSDATNLLTSRHLLGGGEKVIALADMLEFGGAFAERHLLAHGMSRLCNYGTMCARSPARFEMK